jgi:hypothetical protein
MKETVCLLPCIEGFETILPLREMTHDANDQRPSTIAFEDLPAAASALLDHHNLKDNLEKTGQHAG